VVKVLDPAGYGPMTITQSISIAGIEGAGINHGSAGAAIAINAGPNDNINLTHLTIDGIKTGTAGIRLNSGGSLTITHCVVRNFVIDGIRLQPLTGGIKFLIGDTLVSNNSGNGISVAPRGTGTAIGTLDHVSADDNRIDGISVNIEATIMAIKSIANNNNGAGFSNHKGSLLLAHSTAMGNEVGVFVGGTVESDGNNAIHDNRTNV